MYDDDDFDEDGYEDDWPDASDEEENDLRPCPSCQEPIYEDSVRCPYCGEYVTFGRTSKLAGKPMWYIALAILGIIAVCLALTVIPH